MDESKHTSKLHEDAKKLWEHEHRILRQQEESSTMCKDLYNTLCGLRGIEAWLGDRAIKEHFQKTVYPVLDKYKEVFNG